MIGVQKPKINGLFGDLGLDGAANVSRVHLAEALSHRALVDEVRRAA